MSFVRTLLAAGDYKSRETLGNKFNTGVQISSILFTPRRFLKNCCGSLRNRSHSCLPTTIWRSQGNREYGKRFDCCEFQYPNMFTSYLSQCKSLLLGHGKMQKSFVESRRFEENTFAARWHVCHSWFDHHSLFVYLWPLPAWVFARTLCL